MEQLLSKNTMLTSQCVLEKREDAPISGEYVLPEYCADMAEILKCFAYPHIQNRQWSQEQLLVDGVADVRVLYLAEDRRCLHTLEFTLPFSCVFRGVGEVDCADIFLASETKYFSCRAVSPRKIEARGAVVVAVCVDSTISKYISTSAGDEDGLYVRTEEARYSIPNHSCEKVFTISESLEFDHSLPPAEMLLGGHCQAVLHECKLLKGKIIVKGNVHVHQTYTDSPQGDHTYVLDYDVPFSQIIDVAEAVEGIPYKATVQVLSDTEKCSIGPDGENTVLDVSIKLLIQFKTYQSCTTPLLCDAFHSEYPVEIHRDDMNIIEMIEQRYEEQEATLNCDVPIDQWQEVLDVWAQMSDLSYDMENGRCRVKGRVQIGFLVRNTHGEIACYECAKDYRGEFSCQGNSPEILFAITRVHYRAMSNRLDVIVRLHVCITDVNKRTLRYVCDLKPQKDNAYSENKATALIYYADAGESVWDIARRCHASPQSIMHENELPEDLLTDETLLIVPIR